MPATDRSQVLNLLAKCEANRFTGRVEVSAPDGICWNFYCRLGRLVWATGGLHPIRRWRRYLARYCPEVNPERLGIRWSDRVTDLPYFILSVLAQRKVLPRDRAKAIVAASAVEVAFEAIGASYLKPLTYKTYKDVVPRSSLVLLQMGPLLAKAEERWHTWHAKKLSGYCPNLVPVIRDLEGIRAAVPAATAKKLQDALDGKSTLWDLTLRLKQDITRLTLSLLPFVRRELIEFRAVPDLPPPQIHTGDPATPPPVERRRADGVGAASPQENRPLIACIDDSPVSCQRMADILEQAGYRCVTITDSLQALPMLIEHRPALVFLDLVMPVVNGYEICSQIRRVSQFEELPVVMLTSKDGMGDRVRARMVRASGFLTKPAEPDKVLEVLEKFVTVDSQ